MRSKLFLSVLLLGASSAIAQVAFLRDIIITFYGNEFFWGVALASWLLFVALGAKIFEKILFKTKRELSVLLWLHFLTPFLFLSEIFFLRASKMWLGMPGEIPNLLSTILGAAVFPMPLCLVLGGWWTIATGLINKEQSPIGAGWLCNKAYLLETIGFALGGLLFSLFLVGLNEILIAWILFLLNLAAIFWLASEKTTSFQPGLFRSTTGSGGSVLGKMVVAILLLFFILSLFNGLPHRLDQLSQSFRFKNQKLVNSINSPFGNIAVTKIADRQGRPQYNFYESGLLLGTTEDYQFNEIFVHLSLLAHSSPEKVLLIGGGITGAVSEILQHPVKQVYYLELDPNLIESAKKYLSEEAKSSLENNRVKILNADGRHFLEKTKEKFDVILINLPDPSTALLNRFYTQEFFQLAKEKLKQKGILSTYLTFSDSAPNKDLENLNVSVQKSLKQAFQRVVILPEETNFFLASDTAFQLDPEIFQQRLRQREIETKFFNEKYIEYRLTNPRLSQAVLLFAENELLPSGKFFLRLVSRKNETAQLNKDQKPTAYFYNISFWLSRFQPKVSNIFQKFSRYFLMIGAIVLLFFTFFLVKRQKKTFILSFSAATAGFTLMAQEMLIIFFFQTAIGYLYHRLALLLACFMVGMALAIFLINRKIERGEISPSFLAKSHFILMFWSLILIGLFWLVSQIPVLLIKEILLLAFAVLAGFFGAAIFPLANSFYLSSQVQPHKKTGSVYSADLFGSCLGGVIPALILIPVFGLSVSLLVLAILNLWLVFLLAKDIGGENV